MKRICLFAGYDSKGIIHDYVVYYLKELSTVSDVYYMADNEISNIEKEKIKPYTKGAYGFNHKKYDFGSWQELINMISWDKILEYDELILANDSCFGPVYNIQPIFDKASRDSCDFWGITVGTKFNYHLQSYFIVLKKNIIKSNILKEFFANVKEYEDKSDIIEKLEAGLSKILMDAGFKFKCLIRTEIGIYTQWRSALKLGMPFIKISIFKDLDEQYRFQSLINYKKFLKKYTVNYDVGLIDKYIEYCDIKRDYNNPDIKYRLSCIKRSIKDTRKWLIQIKIRKEYKIIRLFGYYIVNTYLHDIDALFTEKELKTIKLGV